MKTKTKTKELLKKAIQNAPAYVPGEQPQDGQYVKLNTNENPYPPSPKIAEQVLPSLERLRLYPDPVSSVLRGEMSGLTGIVSDQIIAVNGSDEALRMIFQTFVDEGETIAAPYPTYVLYRVLARQFGAQWMDVDFPDDFSLPSGLFEAAKEAKVIFLANPNSPSGTAVGIDEVRRFATATQGLLVVDEAYADFAGESCLPLVNEFENVLVIQTLSKSYSLAGLRLGFAFGSKPLIDAMNVVRDSYNVDGLTQAIGKAALSDQETMKENAAKIIASRKKLTKELERMNFRVWPSKANFILCEPPAPLAAKNVYESLKERKVLVRYFNERLLENRLRITIGRDDEIETLLKTLTEVCHAQNR